MLVVVSPAKKLDWTPVDHVHQTAPRFAEDAIYLAGVARRLSQPELRKLMKISQDLAALNQRRFREFSAAPGDEDLRPAAFAFAGDTYQGLEVRTLDPDALHWAQGRLRLLSGLYGLLRPTDGIQPYRLEMGSRLRTRQGADLYTYWGDRIAAALNEDGKRSGARYLLNCASQEYFRAVDPAALALPVVSPVFLDDNGSGPRIVSFHAKRARGAMARFVMEHRIDDPVALNGFDGGGYRFDADRSTPEAPVFLREAGQRSAAA